MPLWRLPDHFSDVLPSEARQLEALRFAALDTLRTWGYELVTPPLLEHLGALTTGTAQDLEAVMFKLVDPASGALLGLRADVTPQVARIDAHLLNRQSPTRLCYCTPALRSVPSDAFAQRESLQLGAELFGHAGLEADIEIQDLALAVLAKLGSSATGGGALKNVTLALSHSGVLAAVFDEFPALRTAQAALLQALQTKNSTDLSALALAHAPQAASLLHTLVGSYGAPQELKADRFVSWPAVAAAVAQLQQLADRAQAQGVAAMIDLADLSGYGYHTGVQFAVYVNGLTTSLLRGGRYDAVGEVYGRARAATGFSFDLRALSRLLPPRSATAAVRAPWGLDDANLERMIGELRGQGHVVVRSLPGHAHEQEEFLCDRELVKTSAGWQIQAV